MSFSHPLVLAHARALLTSTTPEGVTTYIDADFHDPDLIISDARNVLNFNEPVAVMFMGVLGHLADHTEARSIVTRILDAVPSGSYLALYDGVRTRDTSDATDQASADYEKTGAVPYNYRPLDEVHSLFDGLELLTPGLVPISLWRPDPMEIGTITPTAHYGAIARKP